jgi:enoyl-CoA hydratase
MAELTTRREGATGWIVLSNPPRHNAVSYQMWRALPEKLAELERDDAVRVIALRGAGDAAFSAGADIAEFEHTRGAIEAAASYSQVVEQATAALLNVSKPTIARVRGACYGGGLVIAAHCDLRICSYDAEFSLPAARLGIGYSYSGITRVAQIVGLTYCAELIYTARRFSAAEALQMRFVNRVAQGEELDRVVAEYCDTIAQNAPLTIAAGKRCLIESAKDPAERDMRAVQAMLDACYLSEDYREGRAAFLENRKPEYRGR